MSAGSNGDRRPPRPRIELPDPPASAEEAAAVIAAIERFITDTAPAPEPGERPSPWQRAALLEGIGAKESPFSRSGPGHRWD